MAPFHSHHSFFYAKLYFVSVFSRICFFRKRTRKDLDRWVVNLESWRWGKRKIWLQEHKKWASDKRELKEVRLTRVVSCPTHFRQIWSGRKLWCSCLGVLGVCGGGGGDSCLRGSQSTRIDQRRGFFGLLQNLFHKYSWQEGLKTAQTLPTLIYL